MSDPPRRGEFDAPGTAPDRRPPLQVFTEEALAKLRLRDQPLTAAEAELAGPWAPCGCWMDPHEAERMDHDPSRCGA